MRSNPLRWLLLAGAIHITLTLAVFLAGHFQLLPNVFDQHGAGLLFAIDATSYRALSSQLANELQTNGIDAWLAIKAPLHCRLYSILFASIGRILGHNILAAEPLNLLYYLGILSCVYALGREIFNDRTAILAAVIVGLWPSFLMHSTQLIRDSLSILCLLALQLVLTLLLTRTLSWRSGLAAGIAGALLATLFWVLRGNMWNIVVGAVGITILLLLWRMIRERRLLAANMIAIAFVVVTMLVVPTRLESTSLPGVRPPTTSLAIPTTTETPATEGVLTRALKQIGQRRAGFRGYRAQESNIDGDVRLTTAAEVLKFIPRAAVIGFFAPFPRMWFERGSYGSVGRLLSGAETFVMYFLYFGVAACLWRNRRRLETWLLFLVATLGTVALGLVVANAGALYRLRYVFWIMFIIMAAHVIPQVIEASLVHLTVLRTNATKSRMSSSLVSNDAINRHSDISSFQT
ncbi:MAG TPA: STT3 domain-containing protein [Pyrinomonadaceae bacterium]|nr:STT3 domain-containing protein [Pyrinomonadaceae bacterium]